MTSPKVLRICLFVGSYDIERQSMLKKVLEYDGRCKVFECSEKISGIISFLTANFRMYRRHKNLDYDVMIIPWRGLFTYPLAKLICKKPIVFMPTISIYNTLVEDRRKYGSNHPVARIVHFVEKVACKWSDMIISESDAQNYFLVKEYGISFQKCRAAVHSADESIFKPLPIKEDKDIFNIIFFGTFTPHHGTDTILEAANILKNNKDINFTLCGDGIMKKSIERKAKEYNLSNVTFTGFVDKSTLTSIIAKSDVCLGIFGTSGKAADSITNKVCQVLACQKPLITLDSKAMREIKLKNNENSILVSSGDPKKLAEAIIKTKNNKELRNSIALNGYKTYQEGLSMRVTSKKIYDFLQELIT